MKAAYAASMTAALLCVGSAEAADHLGTNGKLVERLVEWCEAKDHAGVMGESNRLLSALIRHSKSKVRHHTSSSNTVGVPVNCSSLRPVHIQVSKV